MPDPATDATDATEATESSATEPGGSLEDATAQATPSGPAPEPAAAPGGRPAPPPDRIPALLESLLFVSDGPTDEAALARALGLARREVHAGLDTLAESLRGRGIRLQRGPDGVQLVTAPDAAGYIEAFLGLDSGRRLSAAALETLAIIAYRQPVTRASLEAVRGVNCDGAIDTLRNRGLIDIAGRADGPGRPALFATTQKFLEYFGLERPEDLPPLPADVAEAAGRLPEHLAQQLPLPAAAPAPGDTVVSPEPATGAPPSPPTEHVPVPFDPIETADGPVWPARAGLPAPPSVWLPGPAAPPALDRPARPPAAPGFGL